MKKQTKKKQIEPKAPALTPAVVSPNPPPPPSVPAVATEPSQYELPPPEELLIEAEGESDQAILRQYAPVIRALRRKHFSFQGIAEWLNERGFTTDRNEVYRVFCRSLTPEEMAYVEEAEREEAEEEAEGL